MTDTATSSVSNASAEPLAVWIEPWCDELAMPPQSILAIRVTAPAGVVATPPIMEIEESRLIIWATCAGTADVMIDGIVQDTCSRSIALDAEMFAMPVKDMVNLIFGDQPATRPAERPPLAKTTLMKSVYTWVGSYLTSR